MSRKTLSEEGPLETPPFFARPCGLIHSSQLSGHLFIVRTTRLCKFLAGKAGQTHV